MTRPTRYGGAWPVLLTPFDEDGAIDGAAYEAMLGWYLERGVGGLFAVCASSEMFQLTPAERLRLARGDCQLDQTGRAEGQSRSWRLDACVLRPRPAGR